MMDLDRLKGRARRAPATLLPRVMAAAAAEQAKPWWRRAFWTWPLAGRLAYGVVVAAAAGAIAGAGAHAAAPAQAALAQAQAAADAGWLVVGALWRLGGTPLQLLSLSMAAACAGFGAGLARLLEPARRTI